MAVLLVLWVAFCTPPLMGAALNPINSPLIAAAIVPIAAAVGVSVGRAG